MIDAQNLTKKFDEVTAVEGLTFHIHEGEVFGLLGPNGAGKTTTVRMLCCLISKTGGEARIADYAVGDTADSLKIRKIIGLVPDNVGLYDKLSVYENLDFYGKLYECTKKARGKSIERFLNMLGLWEKKDVAAGTLSKGMKQKLAIARALIHEPKVLFMDEPTVNLDPEASKTVRDFILELKKEKRTILLNTHNLDEAQRICDRIAILKTRLLTVGTPQQLKESLGGVKTQIQLVQVNDAIVNAVKKVTTHKVEISDNKLIIDVGNIDTAIPTIIEAIVSAGGRIQSVTELNPTLEDVYLKTVK
ncbi:MAG TPA: ABC transporter ATP-binding protein [Dehalococcoidia bacterium]|nr:ABC transporter ATP-binding protein [Dehalococcoidia bacterium]